KKNRIQLIQYEQSVRWQLHIPCSSVLLLNKLTPLLLRKVFKIFISRPCIKQKYLFISLNKSLINQLQRCFQKCSSFWGYEVTFFTSDFTNGCDHIFITDGDR